MAGGRRARVKTSGPTAAAADGLGTDKLYFKIGEVAAIVGVEPHVLRFWEGEFRGLRPSKSRSGQRVYRRRDVELILKIRHLLDVERLTIAGARQRLGEAAAEAPPAPAMAAYVAQQSGARRGRAIAELRALVDRPMDPALDADPLGAIVGSGGAQGLLDANEAATGRRQPLLGRPPRGRR
ncbi:MAG: MerR family transcriptional regulator [Myxococcales bacterium]|nr:MerR family transcriptional regulator [Myxococcales bacterium]